MKSTIRFVTQSNSDNDTLTLHLINDSIAGIYIIIIIIIIINVINIFIIAGIDNKIPISIIH